MAPTRQPRTKSTPGSLGPGLPDHRGGEVEAGDVVPLLGEQQRQRAGAAAEVGDPCGRGRQQVAQQLTPGLPHRGVAQPVVGGLVEGRRLLVPEGDGGLRAGQLVDDLALLPAGDRVLPLARPRWRCDASRAAPSPARDRAFTAIVSAQTRVEPEGLEGVVEQGACALDGEAAAPGRGGGASRSRPRRGRRGPRPGTRRRRSPSASRARPQPESPLAAGEPRQVGLDLVRGQRTAGDEPHHLGVAVQRDQVGQVGVRERPQGQAVGVESGPRRVPGRVPALDGVGRARGGPV